MLLFVNSIRPGRFLRRARCKNCITALLFGLFLSLHALAASQLLHATVCDDAHAAEHHCAVTVFAQGHVDCPPDASVVLPVPPVFADSPRPMLPLHALVDCVEPPGRAPPSFLR